MTTYNYKAKDRSGNTVTGTVDADTPSGAAAVIRERGQLPMDIRPVGGRKARQAAAGSVFARYFIFPLWTGVNIRTLAFFYRQTATMLGSGMSLAEALRSVGSRQRGRLGAIIGEARTSVEQGHALSETVARYPHVFSPLQLALIRVGEGTGLLDRVLDRIGSYLEYEIRVRRKLGNMALYPVIIVVFALLVHISVPHITMLIGDHPSQFFAAIWPSIRLWLVRGLVLVVALKLIFQFSAAKWLWDLVKIQPPVLGSTARKIAMSRFSRAMALLYSAGVPMAQTVSVAADACANSYFAASIKRAVPAIQAGRPLTESLSLTGTVMPVVLDMIATGEKTGSTDATLEKVAEYMDDEADTTIHKMGIALLVIGILVAGAVVLYVLLNFYLPMVNGMMKQAE